MFVGGVMFGLGWFQSSFELTGYITSDDNEVYR